MEIFPIKTRVMNPPQDDIYSVLDEFCPKLINGDIVVIASKILAIHQGRCVPKDKVKDKNDLIREEADIFISESDPLSNSASLTIKDDILIAFAGIDESNAAGYYILWPENPVEEARLIREHLKEKFSLDHMAVIIVDSHCMAMRRGTTGISIGFYGLNPLKDYRENPDIFGRVMKITQANIADALAAAAVITMGEGGECQPMAIIRGTNFVEFTEKSTFDNLKIPLKEDLFYPLLKPFDNF